MIKRKELVNDKPEKEKAPRTVVKVRRSQNINALPDAIVDGNLVAPLNSQIYVELYREGQQLMTLCELLRVDDDGCMHLWNLTLEQWTLLSVKNAPRIFKWKTKIEKPRVE